MKKLSQWLRWLQSASAGPAKKTPFSGPASARIGQLGEERAVQYLKKEKGFRILDSNWRSGKDEMDIIARDRETLVFVEVRARQSKALVSGYHSVNKRKKKALRRCALSYLRQMRHPAEHYRFDIVEIDLQKEDIESIHHFDNVPLFQAHD